MQLSPEFIWQCLCNVRSQSPVIHHITNSVTMNWCANTTLASGASPIMAHAINEISDIIKISAATVLNIGTLDDDTIQSMKSLLNQTHHPVILDPVGAGATNFRTETCLKFIASQKIRVCCGNASEIGALSGCSVSTKGVDSSASLDAILPNAKAFARKHKLIMVTSGKQDCITDGKRTFICENGHSVMQSITGMGCALSSVIASFIAANSNWLAAAVSAVSCYTIAAERAAKHTMAPGSFQAYFLDALYSLSLSSIQTKLKLKEKLL